MYQCISVSVDYRFRVWLKDKDVRVIISTMVLCNANVMKEYDRRRSGLPSAPQDMEYDNSSIEY